MNRFITAGLALILLAPPIQALPALQLYIDGASYDSETGTWIITDNSSFDLYVVGKSEDDDLASSESELEDVFLIISSDSEFQPEGAVIIDGQSYPSDEWTFGSPPMEPSFPPHGILPAWYFMVELGEFSSIGGIGNIAPDSNGQFFDPSEGYDDDSNHSGEIRMVTVDVANEITNLHFDAVSLDDGRRGCFAPFSHDAGYYDELRYPPTGVEDPPLRLPESLVILQAYPNPFNSETLIEFTLSQSAAVRLEMFDSRGRFVTTLTDTSYDAGTHSVRWSGTNDSGQRAASGVYMIKLTTPQTVLKSNIVLLK